MKSFGEMANDIRWGDHKLVAEVLGVSESLVKLVASGQRTDRKGIQIAFNILLKEREEYEEMMKALHCTKDGVTISDEAPAELREELENMLRVLNVDQY